ncbi:ABC transporter substrate-binding protein [Paenibacillus aceris]|uniref:Aldouronate transport system substrate-binding protein n=1 Tax=Paenibacillus aceris TaxID=869555 RepID=A0ABS4I373_9BACL|nr:ABC transporter substrate-binding protein [Paenibacillus aceris]MBP1965353.1 putative aldouronate transport system substrate-binding protein [Paenibacillus aceris]NHW36036.1 ABC transporter substrate-binding protein [Paenibacillus aceris]
MKQLKVTKTVCSVLVASLVLTLGLTGCGSKGEVSETTQSTASPQDSAKTGASLDPVELTWYLDGTPQSDIGSVETELNKILKDKLNVTLHLKMIDWGSYDQKMQVVNAAGENYDLAFTANWANNYYQNVNKGVFIPLDDLLAKYAPTIMQTLPKMGWDATKVNGKIYAIPNYQGWTMTNGLKIQKDLADKYGIKPNTIKKLDDLAPFLAQVKQNNSDMVPYENANDGTFGKNLVYYGFDEIAGRNVPGTIKLSDNSLKVVNQFESEEYKNYVSLMRDWYQKSYVRKDAATLKDVQADRKAGKTASMNAGNIGPAGPNGDVELDSSQGGKEVYSVRLTKPYLLTSSIIATMTGISKTSKHPERAVMLLDLLFKDKQIYNLLAYGIEGKHYKKVSENTIEPIKDSGYAPGFEWEVGNVLSGYVQKGSDPGIWEATKKMNESSTPSPLLGFSFDPTPVKTEIAQIGTVTAQYVAMLETGSSDPDKVLPEFIEKLKKAGSDKIIAEEQKQIDAWKTIKK